MKTQTMSVTTIISKGLVENMKEEALKLAQFYDNNIKIEINTSKVNGIVKLNVTEYNI